MAEQSTIARPYARAAFESASAVHALGPWSEALSRAAAVMSDERVKKLIGNPHVPAMELTAVIYDLSAGAASPTDAPPASARSREELGNFLQLLAQNRRLPLLPEIALQFEALREEAENIATVEVRSARELTHEQAQRLRSALERRLGRTVKLSARIDPSLLGGAVVQYGDLVFDGSLRRSLELMGSAISGA
jgi:F-type H+-transporting ATPase subunit delta